MDTATDLLYGLILPDLAARLMDHRGWTTRQYAERMAGLLEATLLGAPHPGPIATRSDSQRLR